MIQTNSNTSAMPVTAQYTTPQIRQMLFFLPWAFILRPELSTRTQWINNSESRIGKKIRTNLPNYYQTMLKPLKISDPDPKTGDSYKPFGVYGSSSSSKGSGSSVVVVRKACFLSQSPEACFLLMGREWWPGLARAPDSDSFQAWT